MKDPQKCGSFLFDPVPDIPCFASIVIKRNGLMCGRSCFFAHPVLFYKVIGFSIKTGNDADLHTFAVCNDFTVHGKCPLVKNKATKECPWWPGVYNRIVRKRRGAF